MSADRDWEIDTLLGRVVKLKDLIASNHELNTKYAVIEGYISELALYRVKILNSTDEIFEVNSENLEYVHPRIHPTDVTTAEMSVEFVEMTWEEFYNAFLLTNKLNKIDLIQLRYGFNNAYETKIDFKFPCLVRGWPPNPASFKDEYGHFRVMSLIEALIYIKLQNDDDVIEFEDIRFMPDSGGVFCLKGIVIFRRCYLTNLDTRRLGEKDAVKVVLENCVIFNSERRKCGILIDNGAAVSLLYCQIHGSATGIDVRNGGSVIIKYSTIEGCNLAVYGHLKAEAIEIYETNIIHGAILIKEGCQCLVKRCKISYSSRGGVKVQDGGVVHIEDCLIERCKVGIRLYDGECFLTAMNCTIYDNYLYNVYLGMNCSGEINFENCQFRTQRREPIEHDGGDGCKVYIDGHCFPSNGMRLQIFKSDPKAFQPNTFPRSTQLFIDTEYNLGVPRCGACNAAEFTALKYSHCQRCFSVYYCSTICQKKAWPQHKKICRKPDNIFSCCK